MPAQPSIEDSPALAVHGLSALLLQMLHPKVAAGVAHAGSFTRDPWRRLQSTGRHTRAITAGDEATIQKIAAIHAKVEGVLPEAAGKWAAGTPYQASDPDLLLWVFATLIITRVQAYAELFGPPTAQQTEAYYADSRAFATAIGIPPACQPPAYEDLQTYYQGMVASAGQPSDTLALTPGGRAVATAILSMRYHRLPVGPLGRVAATAFLPDSARRAYGLPWRRQQRATWYCIRAIMRWRARHHH